MPMQLTDFDYDLPSELIAQEPLPERDASRMLVVDRLSGSYSDWQFRELPDLLRGDELMVVNNTRVIPARLFARREGIRAEPAGKATLAGGEFLSSKLEILLIRRLEADLWEALVRPGRKVRLGEKLKFEGSRLVAKVEGRGDFGLRQLRFYGSENISEEIDRIGHIPLPPYIRRPDRPSDRATYQTVFAREPGAVAAPTAGLHFTPEVIDRLKQRGIEIAQITLEVGLGTFQPIREQNLDQHQMHEENYFVPEASAESVTRAHRENRPILAIGTTVVRTLEAAAQQALSAGLNVGEIQPGAGSAKLFIKPGYRFEVVTQLLTNFHLPRSTLLVLIAAFAGRESVLRAYRHAVASHYRFYSYGDCMLIR